MSQIPMGKVLFRNIIRHTDAHNKILEESEMWKLRDMEKHSSVDQVTFNRRKPAQMYRGHMHCDRFLEETPAAARDREDERETRCLTRKLYEFEASDPNRWGHSGFKELYPEEFESEKECSDSENLRLRRKRGKAATGGERRKHSKKSSRKKKKKKEKKRRKEQEEEEEEEGPGRGSSSSSERGDSDRRRRHRKSNKSKHRRKKKERERERGRREESGSGDSASAGAGGGRPTRRPRKRRRRPGSDGECHAPDQPHRKKRKDWKAANEEKSEESSED